MSSNYTTVALLEEDKRRLDQIGDRYLEDGASYREIINFLVDELEDQESQYEQILARAIAGADEDDALTAIRRVESDKKFVEKMSEDVQ